MIKNKREFKQIDNKAEYLKEHYPFSNPPEITDRKLCLHCNSIILVGDYKVELEHSIISNKIEEFICCPNAPQCDGTLIDWMNPKIN